MVENETWRQLLSLSPMELVDESILFLIMKPSTIDSILFILARFAFGDQQKKPDGQIKDHSFELSILKGEILL